MKKFALTGLFFLTALWITAQQKTIESAIVKSKTEITFPENPNRQLEGEGDGGGFPTGMESKNTVFFSKNFIKTFNETDFGNNTVIIDRQNKKTTTIIEAMGRKTGYYSNEADEAEMRKRMQERMDSLREARGGQNAQSNFTAPEVEIVKTEETKKIAGYTCKKAIVKTKTRQGEANELTVWYAPEFKMAEGYPATGNAGFGGGGRGFSGSFGGGRGRMGLGGLAGLDKIEGFVMGYEMSRPNGFKMSTEVTRVELDAVIPDKTFEVPKGIELKPASEMQNMFMQRQGRPGQ
ncbi:MAG: hypothetical protein KF746_03050 [Chitinophagaceae bacterium]|nr:hypothetical protein [Chitinophagaceae bacterium]